MHNLRTCLVAATLAATFLSGAQAQEGQGSAASQYQRIAARPSAERDQLVGQRVEVAVDLDPEVSPGYAVILGDSSGNNTGDGVGPSEVTVLYRMAFNDIAEGWSWTPNADPEREDYYRFKFLPLQSVAEARPSYQFEDKIGEAQTMEVAWRYDYFLAFTNLYDFYPRQVNDDAGFAAKLPADYATTAMAARVAMRARAHLVEPLVSESTTFWKATHGRPTDFTLKKRYLVGELDEVTFFDRENGRVLATLRPVGQDQR